jgi:hypothetical protein
MRLIAWASGGTFNKPCYHPPETMKIRTLSLRIFVIGLFVLSCVWLLASFGTLAYSVVSPPRDLVSIVGALEGRAQAPAMAVPAVQQINEQVGSLRRAFRVGYHVETSATLSLKSSSTETTTQVSYMAWFQKRSAPMLLLIQRLESNGVIQEYDIAEGAPLSLVAAYVYPLVFFAFALFVVRRYGRSGKTETPE